MWVQRDSNVSYPPLYHCAVLGKLRMAWRNSLLVSGALTAWSADYQPCLHTDDVNKLSNRLVSNRLMFLIEFLNYVWSRRACLITLFNNLTNENCGLLRTSHNLLFTEQPRYISPWQQPSVKKTLKRKQETRDKVENNKNTTEKVHRHYEVSLDLADHTTPKPQRTQRYDNIESAGHGFKTSLTHRLLIGKKRQRTVRELPHALAPLRKAMWRLINRATNNADIYLLFSNPSHKIICFNLFAMIRASLALLKGQKE